MDSSHWIGSVRFELRSRDSAALEPVRRALKDSRESILMRPLQRALDRADRPELVVRCRRIEIDLGQVGPNLAEILEQRIASALRLQLGPEEQAADGGGRWRDEDEQLIAFLESGLLPWPAPGRALNAICAAIGSRDGQSLVSLARRLEPLFARRPETAGRLAGQCPLGLALRLAAIILGKDDVTPPVPAAAFAGTDDARRLAALMVRQVRGESVPDSERQWLDRMTAGDRETGSSSEAAQAGAALRAEPRGQAPAAAAGRHSSAPEATDAPLDGRAGAAPHEPALPGLLPLDAAGMVLVHPFIASLFRACGLLDDEGGFRGEDERCRAVLLLHFAATGEHAAGEPELALAKLLCGMDFGMPVPRAIDPTAAEQSETGRMLLAAIAHWGALGDSSAEALREAFLTRPGHLVRRGDDWALVVERHGIDILLDRLPWTLGLVLTPFMARPLRVDWR